MSEFCSEGASESGRGFEWGIVGILDLLKKKSMLKLKVLNFRPDISLIIVKC